AHPAGSTTQSNSRAALSGRPDGRRSRGNARALQVDGEARSDGCEDVAAPGARIGAPEASRMSGQPQIAGDRSLTPREWREVRRILDKYLQLPPEEREPFLDEVSSGKPWLRSEIASLIEASQDEDPASEPESYNPVRVGKYQLVHKLGEGGM